MRRTGHIRCLHQLFPALLVAIVLCPWSLPAVGPLDPSGNFFSKLAGRLLRQQLGVELTQIQIAPTNQYDSAMHRLLQVSANVYDATSTNEFPSIFRPLFEPRSNGVFLAGFTNDNSAGTLDAWLETNPYGLPMIIAARKGFPNFNELSMRSEILAQRKLQVARLPGNPPGPGHFPNATNQMYVLSLSNYVGVEAWNAYDYMRSGSYPRPVTLAVSNFTTLWLSNDLGMQTSAVLTASAATNIPANWLGGLTRGFIVPFATNQVFLSNAIYQFANNRFANTSTNAFETGLAGFPLPYWILGVSNRMQFVMTDSGRIIDFVTLDAVQETDLFRQLIGAQNPYQGVPGASLVIQGLWNTNRLFGPAGPTEGIRRQMDISLGLVPTSLVDWRTFTLGTTLTQADKDRAIDAFRVFVGLGQLTTNQIATNSTLVMVAPFNPAAKLSVQATWQANDPNVRHRASDLRIGSTNIHRYLSPRVPATNGAPSSLGRLNPAYAPWGGNPLGAEFNPLSYDRAVCDPGVYSADDWHFPVQAAPGASWLGQIHRGTPWQTLYLKADAASFSNWLELGRDPRTHPTNDWRLAALLAPLFNTNDARSLRSINAAGVADWAATLAGLTVLSNSLGNPDRFAPLQFETNTITAGSPQIQGIVDGINRARTAQGGQYFADVGAFLSVPELSSASPWLNLAGYQVEFGLNDDAYEMLPAQLLSLVHADPVVSAIRTGGTLWLRCAALDGFAYRMESSGNLEDWNTFSEPHHPTNGVFTLPVPAAGAPQFFRAVRLP